MEPEGVVNVLRRLLRSLVPGGVIVDLLAVPPPSRVEADGVVLGELDESRFFPRAERAAAGLDALVAEGMLDPEGEERFQILVHYPSGRDVVDDVTGRTYTRMPAALAKRLVTVDVPVVARESCLVRRLRKR